MESKTGFFLWLKWVFPDFKCGESKGNRLPEKAFPNHSQIYETRFAIF